MRLDQFLSEEERKRPLTDEEANLFWDQYADAYGDAQASFDASIRNLAAAGIGVSAALAAAFRATDRAIAIGVLFFFAALMLNLASHATERRDVACRLEAVKALDRAGAYGNVWVTRTLRLNALAGAAVVAAGICLVVFVFQST